MFFLVLLIPVLVMLFALFMQRLEHRLQRSTVSEQDVEEFLDEADSDEVDTFINEGWARALSKFRLRRKKSRPSQRKLLRGRFFSGRSKTAATPRAAHRRPEN